MNIKHIIVSGFLAISLPTIAQEATSVVNKTATVGEESGNALSTKINRASEKDIIKEWKSKMKDFDGDVKIKKSTLTATGVKIESIDSNPIEIVAEVRKSTEQEHELVVIFIKNGVSMSAESDLAGYTAAKSIVRNFANEMSKEATEDYLKEQNKQLVEDLVKDLEGAEKDHEKATKEIQDAKENIEDAKREIKEAEAKIKEKSKFIGDNKKTKEELSKKVEAQKLVLKAVQNEMELFK